MACPATSGTGTINEIALGGGWGDNKAGHFAPDYTGPAIIGGVSGTAPNGTSISIPDNTSPNPGSGQADGWAVIFDPSTSQSGIASGTLNVYVECAP